MPNGRCRLHGGLSTGPRTPEGLARSRRARWKHGRYSAEAKREYRRLKAECHAFNFAVAALLAGGSLRMGSIPKQRQDRWLCPFSRDRLSRPSFADLHLTAVGMPVHLERQLLQSRHGLVCGKTAGSLLPRPRQPREDRRVEVSPLLRQPALVQCTTASAPSITGVRAMRRISLRAASAAESAFLCRVASAALFGNSAEHHCSRNVLIAWGPSGSIRAWANPDSTTLSMYCRCPTALRARYSPSAREEAAWSTANVRKHP